MPTYRTTVRSPWPAPRAFAYMRDLSHFDEWDPGTKRATVVSGEPGAEGAEYDLTVGFTTLRYRSEKITTDGEGGQVVAIADSSMLRSVDTITVRAHDGGSEVSYDAKLDAKGVFGLFSPVLGAVFNRMGDKAARGLADKLDGTIVTG